MSNNESNQNATAAKQAAGPLVVNCYAEIIASAQAGKVGAKYREDRESQNPGRVTWGIDWAGEYRSSELRRITPKEFHALPADRKLSKENPEGRRAVAA